MRNEFSPITTVIVDYLAEALREVRRQNYTELPDRYFSMDPISMLAT